MPGSGYGTASQRRAPDEGLQAGADRHASRRLISFSAVFLASFAVVAVMALADQGAVASHRAQRPVLLSNMAALSKLAKDATDAMIASDERAAMVTSPVRAARTTDLAEGSAFSALKPARTTDLVAGSSLKPMVRAFPSWKYNVFDPDNETRPHHRWTQRRVREEAKRLIGLVAEAEDWENRKYQQEAKKTEDTKSWMAEQLGNITQIEKEANAHMTVIYQGLKVAEGGIDSAVETTGTMMDRMDWNENKKKRKTWEILEEHHGKLDYNKVLQEQHDLLMKANIYQTANLDKVDVNRIEDEIEGPYKVINGLVEGVRGRIDANISMYTSKSVESLYNLGNFSADEQTHMNTAYEKAMKLHAETLNTANETATLGHSVDYIVTAISARQNDITGEISKFKTLDQSVNKFEKRQNVTTRSVDKQLQALEDTFDSMKERLATLLSALGTVGSAITEEQAAHSALVQQENVEMKNMKDAVAGLEPQVKSILDLQDTVSDLEVNTGKRFVNVNAKLGAMATAKNKTMLEEETLKENLSALLKAIDKQQVFDDSDSASTSYGGLDSVMAPINSEISGVQAMSADVGNINAEMTESTQNLTKRIELLDEGRKKWRDEAKLLHKSLEDKADTKITTEKADMQRIEKSLKELGEKIKAAKDFKEHIMDVHAQLRQELADTTQSLVALDQKFSDLYAKLGENMANMQTVAEQMAEPEEMRVASDRVDIKSQQSLDSVKDVQSDSAHIKTGEEEERAKFDTFKTRLKSVKSDVDEALHKAQKMLKRHPNLFERISCVCYDGDVLNGGCIAGSLADPSTCDICPEGSWCVRGVARSCKATCPGGQVLKGKCPAGSLSDVTTCVPSSAGFYSKQGVAFPCKTTCDPGDELRGSCPAGSDHDTTRCAHCAAGFFCQEGVADECKTLCADGLVLTGQCKRGQASDSTTCETSPAGHFAADGLAVPCKAACPDGQYLDRDCPAGSTQDTSTCEACPDGHFCTGGKTFECKTTCADGEELTGECPAGSSEDVTVCTRCPEGSFCQDGKVSECKKTCPQGQELKGRCRKGSTQDTTDCAQCKADFFCANGVSSPCKEDCQLGLTLEGKCDKGSATDTTVCKPCPEDHFCKGWRVTPCKDRCWEGKILNGKCGEGSNMDTTTCDKCPANYYCKRGLAYECKSQCEDGSLLQGQCNVGSLDDTTRCTPCPAKSFCKDGKVEACKTTCPEGKLLQGFCRAGSATDKTECVPCPAGSFCVHGKDQECVKTCPSGQKLVGVCEEGSSTAITSCDPCPMGSFCRRGKEEECKTTCRAGQYLEGTCEEGSSRDKTSCKRCPEDSFCVDGKQEQCKETCPTGEELKGECKKGSESDTTTCDPCPTGSFCTDGHVFPCKATCPLGEQLVGECVAGSESDTTKCMPCPEGQFCRDGVATPCRTSCPQGHKLDGECSEGSDVNVQCKPCRAGVYCAIGQEMPCKATCEPGHVLDGFCSSGSISDVTTCTLVPEGSFAADGLASLCTSMCPPGQMLRGSCPEGATEDTIACIACPQESWCADGVANPCITSCPNGKMLTGTCPQGSQSDMVTCDQCSTANFCSNDAITPCKTDCEDGKFLEGECSVGAVEDVTHCTPCPSGVFCKAGAQTACATTCTDGKELIGFCSAGSTEDTTSCEDCPAGHFCKDGEKLVCKTSCDDGEVFGGECPLASPHDSTSCEVCPQGFFCQEGLKKACKTTCPAETEMDGTCIAGSVTDTVMCLSKGTPKPLIIKWFTEKTGVEGVEERLRGESSDLLGAEIRLSCPSCGKGHVMGRKKMPLFGAKWLVQFYAAWPDYDSSRPTEEPVHTFPKQGYGRQVADKITATMNGVVIDMPPPIDRRGRVKLGKMAFFTHEFEADELAYRFDFTSQTKDVMARPFIVSGEVTLLRDATTGDEGTGAGPANRGRIVGNVIDGIDGKKISKRKVVNDGYEKYGLTVKEGTRFLIFKASQLVTQVPISNGRFNFKIADGEYTCLATLPGVYAFYDSCRVAGQRLENPIVFSPILGPGMVRVVLSWKTDTGVRDLDSFLLTPHKEVTDPPCEVHWQNKKCLSSSVQLDLDSKSGGPETITIQHMREGRYRYRVSEYKGPQENAERLKLSGAFVSVYTAGGYWNFEVGRDGDGFLKGNNWYVMTIDGNGMVEPCNEDTCGNGYHDPAGAGNG